MKKCKTLGITQRTKALEKEKEDMSNEEQTKFRSVAARINFLATDRVDLQFASKDLCRRMASLDKSDWGKARRMERYSMHRPRAVMVFHFEDESEQMQGFADADWAGERPRVHETNCVHQFTSSLFSQQLVGWLVCWLVLCCCVLLCAAVCSCVLVCCWL